MGRVGKKYEVDVAHNFPLTGKKRKTGKKIYTGITNWNNVMDVKTRFLTFQKENSKLS